jgi:hypothetical protein
MAPRLKILMPSGSKKGTQIYYSFQSKKFRQTNPLQVPQRGPYRERYLLTGNFYISLDISLYLKGPMKRAFMFPKSKAPMEMDANSRALINISFGVPSKEAFLRDPQH